MFVVDGRISCDAIRSIADELSLSSVQTKRLLISLCHVRRDLDHRRLQSKFPPVDAQLTALSEITTALGVLKDRAEKPSPSFKAAMNAAGKGFENWLRAAPMYYSNVIKTLNDKEFQRRDVSLNVDELPSQRWLYGIELPRVYKKITGTKFGVSKDTKTGAVKRSGGVAFAIDAAMAIGESPISPETIASHSKEARKSKG